MSHRLTRTITRRSLGRLPAAATTLTAAVAIGVIVAPQAAASAVTSTSVTVSGGWGFGLYGTGCHYTLSSKTVRTLSGQPTYYGTVTFLDNGDATSITGATAINSDGIATATWTPITTGAHTLTARFTDSDLNGPSQGQVSVTALYGVPAGALFCVPLPFVVPNSPQAPGSA